MHAFAVKKRLSAPELIDLIQRINTTIVSHATTLIGADIARIATEIADDAALGHCSHSVLNALVSAKQRIERHHHERRRQNRRFGDGSYDCDLTLFSQHGQAIIGVHPAAPTYLDCLKNFAEIGQVETPRPPLSNPVSIQIIGEKLPEVDAASLILLAPNLAARSKRLARRAIFERRGRIGFHGAKTIQAATDAAARYLASPEGKIEIAELAKNFAKKIAPINLSAIFRPPAEIPFHSKTSADPISRRRSA